MLPERMQLTTRALRLRRRQLHRHLQQTLTGLISDAELDVHFTHMPERYWARADEESVQRHLLVIRQFLRRLDAADSDGTTPYVAWRHLPDRDVTEVEVCSWDRLGLLAHVAGAFAAAELNIVRADIYTRVDNVVLDIFQVCDGDGHCVRDEAKLHLMDALLTAALRPDATADALRAWEANRPRRTKRRAPHARFETGHDDPYSVLVLEADDRIGLLHDIFTVIAGYGVNVTHAIITTENGRTGDVLYLTDKDGQKITAPARLEYIRECVLQAL